MHSLSQGAHHICRKRSPLECNLAPLEKTFDLDTMVQSGAYTLAVCMMYGLCPDQGGTLG